MGAPRSRVRRLGPSEGVFDQGGAVAAEVFRRVYPGQAEVPMLCGPCALAVASVLARESRKGQRVSRASLAMLLEQIGDPDIMAPALQGVLETLRDITEQQGRPGPSTVEEQTSSTSSAGRAVGGEFCPLSVFQVAQYLGEGFDRTNLGYGVDLVRWLQLDPDLEPELDGVAGVHVRHGGLNRNIMSGLEVQGSQRGQERVDNPLMDHVAMFRPMNLDEKSLARAEAKFRRPGSPQLCVQQPDGRVVSAHDWQMACVRRRRHGAPTVAVTMINDHWVVLFPIPESVDVDGAGQESSPQLLVISTSDSAALPEDRTEHAQLVWELCFSDQIATSFSQGAGGAIWPKKEDPGELTEEKVLHALVIAFVAATLVKLYLFTQRCTVSLDLWDMGVCFLYGTRV